MKKRNTPDLALLIIVAGIVFILATGPNITGKASIESFTVNECGTITQDSILTDDVSAIGTCFTIATSGVTLDCAGYTITYGGDGAGPAVLVNDADDVIVQNCVIQSVAYSASSSGDGFGIKLADAQNISIQNNSINTDGVNNNVGVLLNGSNYSRIIDNRITGDSSAGGDDDDDNDAIRAHYSSNVLIENNTLWTNGSDYNDGIQVKWSDYVNVTGNTIYTRGKYGNRGINLDQAWYVRVWNNVIRTLGHNGLAAGITIHNGFNGFISDNTIYTAVGDFFDGQNYGVWVSTGTADMSIVDNTIHTYGNDGNRGIDATADLTNTYVARNFVNATGVTGDNIGVAVSGSGATIEYNRILTNSINDSNTNYGISLNANTSSIVGNNISTDGGANNIGIVNQAEDYNLITNNSIYTTGSTTGSDALELRGDYNNVTNNNVTTAASSSHAIDTTEGSNNTIKQNVLTTLSSSSNGINTVGSGVSNWNISENNITATSYGIRFYQSGPYHQVWSNIVESTNYALIEDDAQDIQQHTIWNNVFNRSGSSAAVSDSGSTTYWNVSNTTSYEGVSAPNIINGSNLGGNWYSDHGFNDTDGDGFTDNGTEVKTYAISSNIDYLPLGFPSEAVVTLPDDEFTANFTPTGNESGEISGGFQPGEAINFTSNDYGIRLRIVVDPGAAAVDLSGITIRSDGTRTAVDLSSATGLTGTHTIYLPVSGNQNKYIYICPDATSLAQVTDTCPGLITFHTSEIGITRGSVTFTQVGDAYSISGLTGSGAGSGEGAGNIPEFGTWAMLIALSGVLIGFFTIRRKTLV
jgi:hypothetical protein